MSNAWSYGVQWSKIEPIKNNTVVIVCTGPSLNNFDFEVLKNKDYYIITVNDAANYVPFADAWFTVDPWGLTTKQIPKNFKGTLYAAVPEDYGTEHAKTRDHRVIPNKNVKYLHRIPHSTNEYHRIREFHQVGLNEDPRCISTGNSGFGALNLAYHMRPKQIIYLGLDATSGYFYDTARNTRSLSHLNDLFSSAVQQLEDKNIEVINASLNSNVKCFKKCHYSDLFPSVSHLDNNEDELKKNSQLQVQRPLAHSIIKK